MENIKVFELAKQMGMETIALMDKLREFKIPVKSHMAELDEILIEQIRSKFDEEKKSKDTTKKAGAKTARKRSTGAATSATPKVVKASSVAGPVAKPKAATKAVAKAAAAAPSPSASAKVSSRTVIRRKANVQEEPVTGPSFDEEAQQGQALGFEPVGRESATLHDDTMETAPEVAAVGSRAAERPEAARDPKLAQVISRIDLTQTMGPRPSSAGSAQSTGQPPIRRDVPPAQAPGNAPGDEEHKFDREEIGKLIKQEALAQAKKAAALARETKIETFNAADFRKRELLFQPKKKKTLVGRAALKTRITTPGAQKRKIKIEGGITVSRLAQDMGVKTGEILKKLIAMGSTVTINTVLDFETAQIIATDYKYEVENVQLSEEELLSKAAANENAGELEARPPVVTVMGHVDHGKTSLLDCIRKANVAAGEAGGITQHIGAYSVDANGKRITFLDTPGHEAFTAMRARGAKVTDIVILVVAADDGIMPQTREAITHAKSAGVPIIVAVNKMDLPQANLQKILQQLTEYELVPEEWGGTTIVAKVSAAKQTGIKELLEMILLQAEILELKANPNLPASGTVIEARLDRGRGPVATLLVQNGTARAGDILIAGTAYGKVRAMVNDKGVQQKEAGPGDPVEVLGLNSVPMAGDTFDVVKDEDVAKEVVEKRAEKLKTVSSAVPLKMSLEDLFAKVQQNETKELPILVKADVQGSAEALKEMLAKLPQDQVRVKVLSSSVGGITESDVLLASASKAVIIGFNVRPESGVGAVAEREGVEIKTYSIVYEIIEDIKKAMTGMLEPTYVEKSLGRAEIRSLFNVPKVGTVAGCYVTDGKITRQASVRLLRDSRVVYEGRLASLRRFKDDVREVATGFECGLGIENYNDLKVGDVVEAYTKEQVATLLH